MSAVLTHSLFPFLHLSVPLFFLLVIHLPFLLSAEHSYCCFLLNCQHFSPGLCCTFKTQPSIIFIRHAIRSQCCSHPEASLGLDTGDSGSKQCKENQKLEKENWLGGTWLNKHWGDGEKRSWCGKPITWAASGHPVLLTPLPAGHPPRRGTRLARSEAWIGTQSHSHPTSTGHSTSIRLFATDSASTPNQSSSCHFSFAKGLCLSLCYLKHLPKTWE